jgi:hypothetical protein
MAHKTAQSLTPLDVRADYAVIIMAVSGTFLALVYLIVI